LLLNHYNRFYHRIPIKVGHFMLVKLHNLIVRNDITLVLLIQLLICFFFLMVVTGIFYTNFTELL